MGDAQWDGGCGRVQRPVTLGSECGLAPETGARSRLSAPNPVGTFPTKAYGRHHRAAWAPILAWTPTLLLPGTLSPLELGC